MDNVNIHIDGLILDPGETTDQDALSEAIHRRMSRRFTVGYSHQVADTVAGAVRRAVSGVKDEHSCGEC